MKLVKEPLFHFLLLAALLFVLEHVFSSTQKEKIIVDQQTAEYLVKQREDLQLRKLSPAEREVTINSFVEDEILYNEAYKRGLDKSDSRMRRNMILKMRGLLMAISNSPQMKSYALTSKPTVKNLSSLRRFPSITYFTVTRHRCRRICSNNCARGSTIKRLVNSVLESGAVWHAYRKDC